MVNRYAGVAFRNSRRVYCFEVGALHLKVNDMVIVETERGINIGQVVVSPERASLPEGIDPKTVKKVLRQAREEDFVKLQENRDRELEVARACREKISELGLQMKLVKAELMHDSNRVVFYFTAENRVDFRELVKDLAHCLHLRVEMRQIGIRDAAGMLGGVGVCGRELCCSAFLSEFAPVTVKMAKEQNLALNPMKISGICGRLMCCLGYEYDNYRKNEGRRKNRRKDVLENEVGNGFRAEIEPETGVSQEETRVPVQVSEPEKKALDNRSPAAGEALVKAEEAPRSRSSRRGKGSKGGGRNRNRRKKETPPAVKAQEQKD
ncbi:MAG: hypothetical protein JXR89_06515 [Deltaproteobacteria bacterium]|nr:hypothetical protein [Deltaproteobacteria bacterium]